MFDLGDLLSAFYYIFTAPEDARKQILGCGTRFNTLRAIYLRNILMTSIFYVLTLSRRFYGTSDVELEISFLTRRARIHNQVVTLSGVMTNKGRATHATDLVRCNSSLTVIGSIVTTFDRRGISRRLSSVSTNMIIADLNVFERLAS